MGLKVIIPFHFVERVGLLSYPDHRLKESIADGTYNYFGQALEYRERRLSLALTFRTFVTSFGFTVGLVMATIGGIFVLGRARAPFGASVGAGDGESVIQKVGASVTTNSPGIVFMLGGVAVIMVTQYFAIDIGAPEIFPDRAELVCTPDQEESGTCWIDSARSSVAPETTRRDEAKDLAKVRGFCSTLPADAEEDRMTFCKVLKELLK